MGVWCVCERAHGVCEREKRERERERERERDKERDDKNENAICMNPHPTIIYYQVVMTSH